MKDDNAVPKYFLRSEKKADFDFSALSMLKMIKFLDPAFSGKQHLQIWSHLLVIFKAQIWTGRVLNGRKMFQL